MDTPTSLSESPFAYPLSLCLFSTLATYIASVLTSNVSQVDRLWTFLPTIYTAYFALTPLWPKTPTTIGANLEAQLPRDAAGSITFSHRALLLLTLITLWMCRLSYNTFRRGLFSLADEDYRWAVLRRQFDERFGPSGGKVVFQIVNLTFIAATQNVLLMALGWPAYLAVTQSKIDGNKLINTDYLLATWALGILFIEFTSDNQQFVYQTYKHTFLARVKENPESEAHAYALRTASAVAWPFASPVDYLKLSPADARRGFVTSGLWGFSRHPNFACEQTFWWLMCAVPVLVHFIPAIALSILFVSSTAYTEAISSSKYPVPYTAYQKRVAMFGSYSSMKGVWWKLTTNDVERKRVEGLVWGDPAVADLKDVNGQ
ncbi:DUF1295-domain-containing protein [Lentinula raphanica]|nr:DUF1295-domain-containing protein [Lentinula raphanica]